MLSDELVELSPVKEYKDFIFNSVFFGFKIKNLYDEKRIKIKNTYNPEYVKINNTCLYGTVIQPNSQHKNLIHHLKAQKYFDIISYCTLLEQHNLTCSDFSHDIQPFMYTVDSHNIKQYISEYSYGDFIEFQSEIPKFQQFMSIYMAIVIPI